MTHDVHNVFPLGNGQAKSINKVVVLLLQRLVNHNQTNRDRQLPTVLCAYKTTFKIGTGHTLFQILYGIIPLMPTKYLVLATRTADLEHLDEPRYRAFETQKISQWIRAQWAKTLGLTHQFSLGDSVFCYSKAPTST